MAESLHAAVARAIADAQFDWYADAEGDLPDALAAAAIRVVLAEATQSIEALPTHTPMGSALGTLEWRRDALAALASLSRI